jgi:hypothetical protein
MTDVKEMIEREVAKSNAIARHWCAELYCENPLCDVREITIRVKEHQGDLPYARGPFTCPACGKSVIAHWAMDHLSHAIQENRDARILVNIQRYRRDHGPAVPAAVFMDDSLPE